MVGDRSGKVSLSWRWPAALSLFLAALLGLMSGVSLTERPDVVQADILTRAYYSMGLFVVGGLDIGMPAGGPLLGRVSLWVAYFGAPILTASAVIDTLIRVVTPQRWQLRRLNNHVVIVGTGELTISYLRVLRRHSPQLRVVVVDTSVEDIRARELEQAYDVTVVVGDITHDFLLRELRLGQALRVVLLGDDNFQGYEAASKILDRFPQLAERIILHGQNLRFLRAMAPTYVARSVTRFNAYHLAATGLVRDHLKIHFEKTGGRDVVVIAGFGLFGQTVLEELQSYAEHEIDTVAVIDVDAERRMLIAEEQQRMGSFRRRRIILQGDIAHPDVWHKLAESLDLSVGEPVVILGTGRNDENLRTALWIKQKYPASLVFARSNEISEFATRVAAEHDIHNINITQLVEENIPPEWLS